MPTPSANPAPAKRNRRLPRVWILVPFILLALYLVLTRTFVTRLAVISVAQAVTGTIVTADSLLIDARGRVVARNVRIKNPSIKGSASEILTVGTLRANIGVPALLQGRLYLQSLSLDDPVVRLSVADSGDGINFAGLRLPEGKSEGIKRLPIIHLRRGIIELGEHAPDGAYSTLRRIEVAGEVLESLTEGGDSLIRLRQIESDGSAPSINVHGSFGKNGLSIAIDRVSLSPFPVESVPSAFRERFRELALEGGVGALRISLDPSGRIEGQLKVTGVDLNLPIKPLPSEDEDGNLIPVPESQRDKPLRMYKTDGTITLTARTAADDSLDATLSGFVEDLPYLVRLTVDGTRENSPFICQVTCKGFELRSNPQLIRYAPSVAQRRYAQFSNPTGTVDATITFRRGRPAASGAPGDITTSGIIDLRDGTAAFERFPYRFHNMRGRWTFDDAKVIIESLQGEAPSGAKISANGMISPVTSDAAVTINVQITNLPIDDTLEAALGKRRKILTALFNKQRYAQLVIDGLVLPSSSHADARDDSIPVFDLGGRVNVDVVVQRDPSRPENDRWIDTIDISLPKAGVIAEKFPYPLIAENVRIIKRNDDASVEGGSWRGLRGGSATASASADLLRLDDPALPFCPDITIRATDVPLDDLFLHALPNSSESMGDDQSPRALLSALKLQGRFDCDVTIGLTPDGEEGFDARASFSGVTSSPLSPLGSSRILARDATGSVRVTQDLIHADLHASLHPAPGLGTVEPASLRVLAEVIHQDGPSRVKAVFASPKFDAALYAEDFVRVFSRDAESDLQRLRATCEPAGSARLAVDLALPGDGSTNLAVAASDISLSLSALQSRALISNSSGSLLFQPEIDGKPGSIRFDAFSCTLASAGEPPGTLAASGAIRTDGAPLNPNDSFSLSLTNAHFHNPLIANSFAGALGERAARHYRALSPRGVFDLNLTLSPRLDPDDRLRWSTQGVLKPHSIAFLVGKTPVAFFSTAGDVLFTPDGGAIVDLALEAPDWSVSGSARWTYHSDSIELCADYSLDANGLPDSLRAILPTELTDIVDQLQLRIAGDLAISEGSLTLLIPPSDASPVRAMAGGHASLSGARLDLGLEVTDCSASIDFAFSSLDPRPDTELFITSDRLKVNGVRIVNAASRLKSGPDGEVFIPIFTAASHGGRIAGSAVIAAPDSAGRREFTSEFRAANVRFASVVSDLRTASDPAAPGDRFSAQGVDEVLDESRGRLAAQLSIGGYIADPASRRGRGFARVNGGGIVSIPLVVPLIRASNLQLPVDEKLDYARAAFYIDGPIVNFEELLIASRSVAIVGFGLARFPDATLDLRVRLRNSFRIPLLTDLVETLREQLFSFRVRGTLGEPKTEIVPFAGATRLFERAVGSPKSDQERRLDQIERTRGRDSDF